MWIKRIVVHGSELDLPACDVRLWAGPSAGVEVVVHQQEFDLTRFAIHRALLLSAADRLVQTGSLFQVEASARRTLTNVDDCTRLTYHIKLLQLKLVVVVVVVVGLVVAAPAATTAVAAV